MGIPYICPYNVHSIMNPILVMCTGLGYFFNLYRNKPLVREGGVVIMTHPTLPDFNPVHHPSYIDFYEQVLADTTDPHEMSKTWEERYAYDDWYRHLYRTSYAYHGVHPFYMWYWGAHGMRHCGRVIIVGGDDKAVAPPRLHVGVDAQRRPRDGQRRRRPLPHDHPPAHPAADDRRRADERAMTAVEPVIAHRGGCGRRHGRPGRPSRCSAAAAAPLRNTGFPYRRPTVPRGVEVPAEPPTLGADYDTEWARSPVAKAARNLVVAGPQRLLIDWVTDPEIHGHDRLADLLRAADDDSAVRRR